MHELFGLTSFIKTTGNLKVPLLFLFSHFFLGGRVATKTHRKPVPKNVPQKSLSPVCLLCTLPETNSPRDGKLPSESSFFEAIYRRDYPFYWWKTSTKSSNFFLGHAKRDYTLLETKIFVPENHSSWKMKLFLGYFAHFQGLLVLLVSGSVLP